MIRLIAVLLAVGVMAGAFGMTRLRGAAFRAAAVLTAVAAVGLLGIVGLIYLFD